MNPTVLIARREIVARTQQRSFRVGLLITLVLVALATLAPKLIGGRGGTSYDVAVIGLHSEQLSAALQEAARDSGVTVRLRSATVDQARQKVRKGSWDVAIVDDQQILAKEAGSRAVALVQAAHQSLATRATLAASGLTPRQVDQAFSAPPLAVSSVKPSGDSQKQLISTITVVFLFSQLIGFCTWVAMGVVEEKSSRVVELVLSAVRPLQLLAGKLIGIGLLAMVQVALLAGTVLGVATAAGTLDLPGSTYLTVLIGFGWFVLGFAFFAAVSAALASLVSRQEEVSGVLSPVTGLLLVSYLASFAVTNAPDAAISKILSIAPPFSAIGMPARIARGGVSAGEVLLSVALMLAATAVVLVVASRIYRAAVLHAGSRLTLRRAWQGEVVGAS